MVMSACCCDLTLVIQQILPKCGDWCHTSLIQPYLCCHKQQLLSQIHVCTKQATGTRKSSRCSLERNKAAGDGKYRFRNVTEGPGTCNTCVLCRGNAHTIRAVYHPASGTTADLSQVNQRHLCDHQRKFIIREHRPHGAMF